MAYAFAGSNPAPCTMTISTMKIPRLIGLNATYLFLLGAILVASFQSFDRNVFECEFICRNPHILYTLSLPIFLLATILALYLLLKTNKLFTPVSKSKSSHFLLRENRALLWIWLLMCVWTFELSMATDADNFRGPFVWGILLSLLYTIYNIFSSLFSSKKN